MKLILFLMMFAVVACNSSNTAKDLFKDAYLYQASCLITNSSNANLVCIEYSTSFMSNTNTDCINQNTTFNGLGMSHNTGQGAPACTQTQRVGRCDLSNRRIHFYSPDFDRSEAQTECNILNGTLI